MYAWSVYKHAVVAASAFMLRVVKMLLKEEDGSSHGNYIAGHGNIMELCF